MTKTFFHFVSTLFRCDMRKALKLVIIMLLSGSFQVLAASGWQGFTVDALNNHNNSGELLAYLQPTDIPAVSDQQKTVSGRVTDASGEALPGVNIIEKGTLNGAISDFDGRYTISVASSNSVLVFSFVGYTSQELTVGSQTTVNVTLAESAIGLDEIVVVGYGTQQKRTVSGSVANVTEKNFNAGITRTAADFIQGKVAGLTITTSTGDVTASQSMRLRGTSSLTGSSELS